MKFITFFVVLVTTSAAFPFWNDEPEGHLEARDDEQKLINPDNEDPYYEPITDSDIEKSRILSGIGPEEAKQRYFDWDESCDNEYDRKKIVATFVNFQQLVEQASEKLGKLSEGLEENESKVINKKNRQKIAKEDPAFTQMFRGFDYLVDDVKDGFDKIMANVKNSKRGTAEKPGALRFICSARDQVLNQKGTPFCG